MFEIYEDRAKKLFRDHVLMQHPKFKKKRVKAARVSVIVIIGSMLWHEAASMADWSFLVLAFMCEIEGDPEGT